TILAEDFAEHGYDLRRLVRVITRSQVYRMNSASERAVGDTEEAQWAIFPLSRLRPEQVAGSVLQASQISTVNSNSHIIIRMVKYGQTNDFVTRYGDPGDEEFENRGGTIPQRLLLMNGELVQERIKPDFFNATQRLNILLPDDDKAIEAAYLATLSRRPTPTERDHFRPMLADTAQPRGQRLQELYWALINSTEFSWNH
ncbi:MAG: DUF1553 domain-containing protein, partial [Gemmataceae bacterium]